MNLIINRNFNFYLTINLIGVMTLIIKMLKTKLSHKRFNLEKNFIKLSFILSIIFYWSYLLYVAYLSFYKY